MKNRYVVVGREGTGKTSFVQHFACKEHRDFIKCLIGSRTTCFTEYSFKKGAENLTIQLFLKRKDELDTQLRKNREIVDFLMSNFETNLIRDYLDIAQKHGSANAEGEYLRERGTIIITVYDDDDKKDKKEEFLKRIIVQNNDIDMFPFYKLVEFVRINLRLEDALFDKFDFTKKGDGLEVIDSFPISDIEGRTYYDIINLINQYNFLNPIYHFGRGGIILTDSIENDIKDDSHYIQWLMDVLKYNMKYHLGLSTFFMLNKVDDLDKRNKTEDLKAYIINQINENRKGFVSSKYSEEYINSFINSFFSNIVYFSGNSRNIVNDETYLRIEAENLRMSRCNIKTESAIEDYDNPEQRNNVRENISYYIDRLVEYYDIPVKLFVTENSIIYNYSSEERIRNKQKRFDGFYKNTKDNIRKYLNDMSIGLSSTDSFFRGSEGIIVETDCCKIFYRNMRIFYGCMLEENPFFPFSEEVLNNDKIESLFISYCFYKAYMAIGDNDLDRIRNLIIELLQKITKNTDTIFGSQGKLCFDNSEIAEEKEKLKEVIIDSFWRELETNYKMFRKEAIKGETMDMLNRIVHGERIGEYDFEYSVLKRKLYDDGKIVKRIADSLCDAHKDIKQFIYRNP